MIGNRCTLSAEAARWFDLTTDPFDVDNIPSGDEIFTDDKIQTIVNKVKDAILNHRFIAVIGDVGTGKTLLKQRVAAELAEDNRARLLYPELLAMEDLTVQNIAHALLVELGQTPKRDKTDRVKQLKRVLTDLQQEGVEVAMLIDECHRLEGKVVSSLKNFWELSNGSISRLLGVILFGQPKFKDERLREADYREIRLRIKVIDMPTLNGSSRDYIAHRLKTAGGNIDDLLEDRAIDLICKNAKTPLSLGNLVNEALEEAFDKEEKRVAATTKLFTTLKGNLDSVAVRDGRGV
jgi:type II secretory pathway predicted ATPase ExeA